MNSPNEYISTLVELGLTPSQAKVYIALIKLKNPTAQTINKISGILRPDVYRVLGELEEVGIVEKIISSPEKFHAIPPSECVSILLQKRISKTHQLQKEALKLSQALQKETVIEESDEKYGFTIITGKKAVYAKAEKIIKSTQESICFVGLRKRTLVWLSNALPSMEEALDRSVDCRVIMRKPEKDLWTPLKRLGKHSNFALKLINEKPETAFSIWDQKEILMATSTIDGAAPAPVLWSNNKCIVDLCREHFECLWLKAEKATFDESL